MRLPVKQDIQNHVGIDEAILNVSLDILTYISKKTTYRKLLRPKAGLGLLSRLSLP